VSNLSPFSLTNKLENHLFMLQQQQPSLFPLSGVGIHGSNYAVPFYVILIILLAFYLCEL